MATPGNRSRKAGEADLIRPVHPPGLLTEAGPKVTFCDLRRTPLPNESTVSMRFLVAAGTVGEHSGLPTQ